MRTGFGFPLAALAAAAAISGCGSKAHTASMPSTGVGPTTSGSSAAGAVPSKLRGTYERKVTEADIVRTRRSRREGPGQNAPAPGVNRLVLSRDTMRTIDVRANLTIGERIAADSSGRLTIAGYEDPARSSYCGPETSQRATYRWSLADNILTLTSTNDRCADRDSILSGRWVKRY